MDDIGQPVSAKIELLRELRDLHQAALEKDEHLTQTEILSRSKEKGLKVKVTTSSLSDYLKGEGGTLPSKWDVLKFLFITLSEAILPDKPVSTLEQLKERHESALRENTGALSRGGRVTKHRGSSDEGSGWPVKITNEATAGRDCWERITAEIRAYRPGLLRRRCEFGAVFADLDAAAPVGRTWLRDAVWGAFADMERHHGVPGGYVFIEGDAGVGKTTFAAWFTAWEDDAVPHFVLSTSPQTRNADTALRSLAAHIVARYKLNKFLTSKDMLAATVDGPDGLVRVLSAAVDPARKRGRKIVLVIDGLDQVLPAPGDPGDPDGAYLPLGLPAEALPAGVYVVATLRKGIDLQVRPARSRVLRLDVHDFRNHEDQAKYLKTVLADDSTLPNRIGVDARSLVDAVASACAGSWIYMRYLLADLSAGRIGGLDEMRNLPTTVQGYYAKVLGDLRRYTDEAGSPAPADSQEQILSRYTTVVVPVLCALAAAYEPLSAEIVTALADLADAETAWVERCLGGAHLGAFIRREHDQVSGAVRYSPYHSSFRDFLTGAGTNPESHGDLEVVTVAAQARRAPHRIVDRYLTAWGGLDHGLPALLARANAVDLDSRYGVRHLIRHLEAVGREAEVHRLLRCEGTLDDGERPVNVWAYVHEGMPDVYRGHLQTALRLVIRSAADGTRPDIGIECRYLLMLASVRSTIRATSPAILADLVRRGLRSPLAALVDAAATEDRDEQAALLAAIAPHLPGAVINWAQRILGPPDTTATLQAFYTLVDHNVEPFREQQITALWELMRSTPDDGLRSMRLVQLAPLLRQPRVDEAVELALTLTTTPHEVLADGTERRSVVAWGADTALCVLAGRASEQVLDTLFTRAEELMKRFRDPQLARALVPRLSEEKVLHLAEVAQRTQAETSFKDPAWSAVAHRVDEPRRRVLAALRTNDSSYGAQYAQKLARAAPYLSAAELTQIAGTWRQASRVNARACVFAALAPWMPLADQRALINQALKDLERDTGSWIVTLQPTLAWLAPVVRGTEAVRAAKLARRLKYGTDLRSTEFGAPVMPAIMRGLPEQERDRLLAEYFEEARQAGTQGEDRAAKIIAAFAPLIGDKMMSRARFEDAIDTAAGFTGRNRVAAVEALLPHLTDRQLRRVTDQRVELGDGRAVRAAHAAVRATLGRLDEALELIGDDVAALLALAATAPRDSQERLRILRQAAAAAPRNVREIRPLLPAQQLRFWSESDFIAEVLDALPDRRPYIRQLCKGPYRSGYSSDYSKVLTLMLSSMTGREREKTFWKVVRDTSAIERAKGFAVLSLNPPESMPDAAQRVVDQPASSLAAVRAALQAGLVRLLPEHERPAAATAVLEQLADADLSGFVRVILDCIAEYLTPEQRLSLLDVADRTMDPPAVLVPLLGCATGAERDAVLRSLASYFGSFAHSDGLLLSTPVLDTVDGDVTWFWQNLLARLHGFTRHHHKATLLSVILTHAAEIHWHSIDAAHASPGEVPGTVGSIGQALWDLPRPELLTTLVGALRHILTLGGEAAVLETGQAIDDVSCWWP